MTDLSGMSDQELIALYKQAKSVAPGGQAKGSRGLSAQEQKALITAREAASHGLDVATKGEEFIELNKEAGTGGVYGLPGVSEMVAPFNKHVASMHGLTNAMAPMLRAAGSGAMSDKDVALFKRSVPNADFPGPTNKKIQERLQGESDRKAAYAAFLDKWAQTRGTLQGADTAFLQFWRDREAKKPGRPAGYRPRKETSAAKYLGTE